MSSKTQMDQKKDGMAHPIADKPLNFRVPAAFHREFKVFASQTGISMVELLEKSFRAYVDKKH